MENNLVYQVQQLLVQNKVSFDKEELAFQIESHPSYPSLHAITGVLSHLNIDNIALDVPVDKATIDQLPKSFLAQVVTKEGRGFAVASYEGQRVNLFFSSTNKNSLSLSQFLKQFTGIVVAVEKDQTQDEPTTSNWLLSNVVILLLGAVLMSLVIIPKVDKWVLIHSSLSVIGMYISYALIKQDIGLETVLGNAICSKTEGKSDCESVLSSQGAKLFKFVKLSDLSLVYFSTLTFTSLLFIISGSDFSLPFLCSVLALPVTLYSLYYQYSVAKKWCSLCISLIVLLWSQAALILLTDIKLTTFPFHIENILTTSSVLLLVSASWYSLAPNIKKLNDLKQVKTDYFRFKKNYNIFSSLMAKSAVIDTAIDHVSEIVIGNKEAPLSIMIVTNPFCGHCKSAHTLVENLYKSYANEVQICIRFNINTTNPNSDAVKIASRLIELYHIKGSILCMEALRDIYGGVTPSDWFDKWKDCESPELYIDTLKKEQNWCLENKIHFTPEILINGKSYPKEYDRGDLIYFIEDLSESCIDHSFDVTQYPEQAY